MIQDKPFSLGVLFGAAEDCGFFKHDKVSNQRLTVLSLEAEGDLLRFFHPEGRVLPNGTQLNGSIGLALRNELPSRHPYDMAIFHNILNYDDLSHCDRIMENKDAVETFLELLRSHLCALPKSPAELVNWSQDASGWLGKQISWQRPQSLAFFERAVALTGERRKTE